MQTGKIRPETAIGYEFLKGSLMTTRSKDLEVLAVKDEETQRPIPSAWRPVIRAIVKALMVHDYSLSVGIPGVVPIPTKTATQIANYIQDYGATLIELSEETWNSSVCIWMGKRWDALIDLWTDEEGRSDLVLSVQVTETDGGFVFQIYMVYVP
jgi:predicted NBD/HSP70 family sugar kinase